MNGLLEKFEQDGYVILDCNENELIESIDKKFENLIKNNDYSTNSAIYSYNDKPRIVDAYKKIHEIKEFSQNNVLIDFLKSFYKSNPLPFSNIAFKYGSEQPLHSDYVHHVTVPELLLCGAWTALEDIKKGSGELIVVPKSHKLEIFKYKNYGLQKPKSLEEIKFNYSYYEKWVDETIANEGLIKTPIYPKKGQTVLWQANLFHGGGKINNSLLTRKSFVIHYTFDDATLFYNPNFSFFKDSNDYFERSFDFF